MIGHSFQTDLVYTFGFWQGIFDPFDYCAHVPLLGALDVSPYLGGQPMLMQAKNGVHGENFWCVEMWHEKLVVQEN